MLYWICEADPLLATRTFSYMLLYASYDSPRRIHIILLKRLLCRICEADLLTANRQ